jgi:hypothetical protein
MNVVNKTRYIYGLNIANGSAVEAKLEHYKMGDPHTLSSVPTAQVQLARTKHGKTRIILVFHRLINSQVHDVFVVVRKHSKRGTGFKVVRNPKNLAKYQMRESVNTATKGASGRGSTAVWTVMEQLAKAPSKVAAWQQIKTWAQAK